jgi:hypothetical protein
MIRHSAPRRAGNEGHVMVTRSMRWFGSWGLPHLSDESLLELHALLLAGEHSVAARYLRHVKQCEACSSRLDAVRDDAAALRRDVTASADAQITSPRLERQFDVIMRRLEGHSGRVLPFPTTVHRPAPAPSLRRWVAMAAACGLLIGVGAGRMIAPASPSGPTLWQADGGSSRTRVPSAAQETDEQMLVEIDAALTRSRTKEFRALDELTPRIVDARARARR